MPDMLLGEFAVHDTQQRYMAGIDSMRTGGDAVAVAVEIAVFYDDGAIGVGSRQNAVFIVDEAACLHRQVRALRPDAGAVMTAGMCGFEGDVADGNVASRGDEEPLVVANLVGDDDARPHAFDDEAVRLPQRAVGVDRGKYPDDIPRLRRPRRLAGKRVGLARSDCQNPGAAGLRPIRICRQCRAPGQHDQQQRSEWNKLFHVTHHSAPRDGWQSRGLLAPHLSLILEAFYLTKSAMMEVGAPPARRSCGA